MVSYLLCVKSFYICGTSLNLILFTLLNEIRKSIKPNCEMQTPERSDDVNTDLCYSISIQRANRQSKTINWLSFNTMLLLGRVCWRIITLLVAEDNQTSINL